MWAIKNFVCGPSASVALRRRPYPGAISQKQTARGHQPYRTLQCSTLVGGNVGSVHTTRSLVGRAIGHVAMNMRRSICGSCGQCTHTFLIARQMAWCEESWVFLPLLTCTLQKLSNL